MSSAPGEITLILSKAKSSEALAKVIPLVYQDLHGIAINYFRRENPGHTLQPTALLHEACLRLLSAGNWRRRRGRCHRVRAYFFGAASRAMRQVLVEHARRKQAQKRGGRWQRVDLESVNVGCDTLLPDILSLDEALERLEAFDSRLSAVVDLRFFGHLSEPEIAHVLGIGASTVRRRWAFARAWLRRELASIPQ